MLYPREDVTVAWRVESGRGASTEVSYSRNLVIRVEELHAMLTKLAEE
jgi:hypothetical protein